MINGEIEVLFSPNLPQLCVARSIPASFFDENPNNALLFHCWATWRIARRKVRWTGRVPKHDRHDPQQGSSLSCFFWWDLDKKAA
jgi:hypothetical protein